MKYAYANFGIVILGLTLFAIVMLFENITINNEADYYVLKEATEAAMYDSIDISYFRVNGELKISEQKFVENFTKRFSNNIMGFVNKYTLEFYDIMESPPKVSIIVRSSTDSFSFLVNDDFDVVNNLTAILGYEYNGDDSDLQCSIGTYNAYYYSHVVKGCESDDCSSDSNVYFTNRGNENLCKNCSIGDRGLGQVLMPPLLEEDDNYTYDYTYLNPTFSFYDGTVDGRDSDLEKLYTNFVSYNTSKYICGYPVYRASGGYRYPNCVDLVTGKVKSNLKLEDLDDINPYKNSGTLTGLLSGVYLEKFELIKLTDYAKEDVRNTYFSELGITDEYYDKMYLISWQARCSGEFCLNNITHGEAAIYLVLEVPWVVKKCPK